MPDERRGTLADDAGAFVFEGVDIGVHVLTVEQYGFESIEATVMIDADAAGVMELELQPRPVMLDGLSVVGDRIELMEGRLRSRRRAVATSSRAFELERLVRSPAFDLIEFLALEAFVSPVPCGRRQAGRWCVVRRGRLIEPRVYID